MSDTSPAVVASAAPVVPDSTAILQSLVNTTQALTTVVEGLGKGANSNTLQNRNSGPFVRTGEDPLSSRGFQYSRVFGILTNKLERDQAKVEIDVATRLQKEYVERGFYTKEWPNSVIAPLGSSLMLESGEGMEKLSSEVGDIIRAGAGSSYDKAEMDYIRRTLGWQDAGHMGELVGPPVYGEPIELLRNQEVFMKAGARVVPFPPSGRIVWPRMTGATTAYWVGTGASSRTITGSEPATGDLTLQVKKIGALVTVPNELFRFPTVSVEQIIREDMMKSVALKMDKAFLDSVGSAVEPKGLLNYANVLSYTAGLTGVDGDTLQPEDILRIIGTVEEQNISFNAWVMRPLMYAALANRRADAVTAGDSKGMFLFNVLRDGMAATRDVTNNSVGSLESYPVFKSNQIVNTRAKGAATNLSYIIGGQFEQYLIAMSGVMEFAMATQGDTIFPQDQSQIRLTFWADGGPRHEEAFIKVDTLVVA